LQRDAAEAAQIGAALEGVLGHVRHLDVTVREREAQQGERRLPLDLALGADDALAATAGEPAGAPLGPGAGHELVLLPRVLRAGKEERPGGVAVEAGGPPGTTAGG